VKEEGTQDFEDDEDEVKDLIKSERADSDDPYEFDFDTLQTTAKKKR